MSRRNEDWWYSISPDERSTLWYLERAKATVSPGPFHVIECGYCSARVRSYQELCETHLEWMLAIRKKAEAGKLKKMQERERLMKRSSLGTEVPVYSEEMS